MKFDGQNDLREYTAINLSYPDEYIELYVINNFGKIDPLFKENVRNFSLQYFEDTFKKYGYPKDMTNVSWDFGIKEGYAYGVRSLLKKEGSFFSFCDQSLKREDRTEIILRCTIPHLHQALKRVLFAKQRKEKPHITEREIEILQWIGQGKSNWEISVILNISESTVKFHIKNIMAKLDASSRAHSLAIAIELGLIDIE